MSRSDYVPKNDDQLLDWSEKFISYASEYFINEHAETLDKIIDKLVISD